METPPPEVHPTNPCPDLPVPADAQHLGENGVGKDKGPLVFPTPSENPLSLRINYGREPATYCTRGSNVPAG